MLNLTPKTHHAKIAYSLLSSNRLYTPPGKQAPVACCFLNLLGRFIEKVGVPGIAAEHTTPRAKLLYFTTEAKEGVIEIVQQASSLDRIGNGSNSNVAIGIPGAVREIYNKHKALSAIMK